MKVALINMPFADARLPSIALAQLRSVLQSAHGDRIDATVYHLNHDFAQFLTPQRYEEVSTTLSYRIPGLGDLLFTQEAFPDQADTFEAQVKKTAIFYRENRETIDFLLEVKPRLGEFLDDLIDRYELDSCSVVGLTSMFVQNVPSFALARRLKLRNPEIVTVMGGANCETPMGQVIAKNVETIDFVFSGSGLRNFPELIGHLLDGNVEPCHELKGVFSAQRLAKHEKLHEVGPELPIDAEIPLDYDDFFVSVEKNALDLDNLAIPFETSRGCWWGERSHCTFCGLNGLNMGYRSMAPDKAHTLIQSLFDRYYPRVKHFHSVDNIMPREYLTDLFPNIETPDDASLFYEVKADLKDREMEVLAKAGVDLLQPGIEALSTPVLKLMRKGTTALQNIRFLKNCLAYGIGPTWNLLIGFPGEEEEVYEKYLVDLPKLVHLPPPKGVFPIRFDRFSPYFNQADEFGLRLKPFEFYEVAYPFPKEDLFDLAYYFVDVSPGSYKKLRNKWRRPMQEPVNQWRDLWEPEGKKPPILALSSDGLTVYDTRRGGEPVLHQLTTAEAKLLQRLDQPCKPAVAAKSLGVTPDEVEGLLSRLAADDLVIEDRGIYMSLICPNPAAEDNKVERSAAGG